MIIFKSKDSSYKDPLGLRLIKVVFLSGKRVGYEITFRHGYVKWWGNRSLLRSYRDAGKLVLSFEPPGLNIGEPLHGRWRHCESFLELHLILLRFLLYRFGASLRTL